MVFGEPEKLTYFPLLYPPVDVKTGWFAVVVCVNTPHVDTSDVVRSLARISKNVFANGDDVVAIDNPLKKPSPIGALVAGAFDMFEAEYRLLIEYGAMLRTPEKFKTLLNETSVFEIIDIIYLYFYINKYKEIRINNHHYITTIAILTSKNKCSGRFQRRFCSKQKGISQRLQSILSVLPKH
jgi:hypothetical protein